MYIPTELEKDDRSMPPEAMAPPTNVVHLIPILSVMIPARGEKKNVDPIAREPTSAGKKKNIIKKNLNIFGKINITIKTFLFLVFSCSSHSR
jgi:hypothetical protein